METKPYNNNKPQDEVSVIGNNLSSEEKKTAVVAKNTFLLYIRMVFIMLVSLYTTRILLATLGASDYGINDVVAGVVGVLGFVNTSLSAATQRFLSFSLGKGNKENINKIFSASVNIYIILSLLVLLIGETVGVWFVNEKLVIPENRMVAANWVFQFALVSCVFSMLSVPYMSAIIAHERMSIYAIIGLIDCFLRLGLVFVLGYVPIDKLVAFGFLSMMVHVLIAGSYALIAYRRYNECHYRFTKDTDIHKQLFSFSGWTLWGAFSFMANSQGINIIINLFFGTIVNAARAVASQVSSAIALLCNSFFMALRPAMVKAYAEGENYYLEKLFFLGNKYTYYLLLMFCLPAILCIDYILHLWLGEVDEYMVVFTRLAIVYSIVLAMQNPITIIIQAIGNIRNYCLLVDSFTLLTLPISYILLKLGNGPETTYYAIICVFLFAHFLRLGILKKMACFISIKKYMLKFTIPAFVITSFYVIVLGFVNNLIQVDSLFKLFAFIILSVLLVCATVYLFALNEFERTNIKALIKR